MNKQLFENLEHYASGGATLRELETEIDNRRLSDLERETAWVYAWALVKRPSGSPNPDDSKRAAQ